MTINSRRAFLRNTLAGASVLLPFPSCSSLTRGGKQLRFGLCADVHHDIMHDAVQRMQSFVGGMRSADVDFIAQLGDFVCPYDYNQPFMDAWNSFEGPRHHVIGNHDMDGGFTREQVVSFYGMPSRYHAFDSDPCRFLVLDGNDKKPDGGQSGYSRWIGQEQLEWLEKQLELSDRPVIILSHQSLENEDGVGNGSEVRAILEKANEVLGGQKVLACFSGHHHLDFVRVIHDIPYVQVNSMSYQWVGGDYQRVRYSKEVDESHPWIKYTAPYRDPLWMQVTLEPGLGLHLQGVQSEWVGPSPQELGAKIDAVESSVTPQIRTRRFV
jgi:calcineurin-like phosphoesterase family protein